VRDKSYVIQPRSL